MTKYTFKTNSQHCYHEGEKMSIHVYGNYQYYFTPIVSTPDFSMLISNMVLMIIK